MHNIGYRYDQVIEFETLHTKVCKAMLSFAQNTDKLYYNENMDVN